MAEKPLNVAIGSTTSKPADIAGNLAQIEAFARRAAGDGAHVLLTPEMSACGYGPYPDVLATAEPAGAGPVYDGLARLARETGVVVAAGFVETAAAKRHLAHYIVYPDGRFVVQRKHRVTLLERPLEPGVELIPPDYVNAPPRDPADPGMPKTLDFQVFAINGVRCAMVICADFGIPALWDRLRERGVEFVLHGAAGGGTRENRVNTVELRTEAGRKTYMKWLEMTFFPGGVIADCLRLGMGYAAVNMCGYDGRKQYHMGHGMIVMPMGEVPGFFHGLPNLDRQRLMYAYAEVELPGHDAEGRNAGAMEASVKPHGAEEIPRP